MISPEKYDVEISLNISRAVVQWGRYNPDRLDKAQQALLQQEQGRDHRKYCHRQSETENYQIDADCYVEITNKIIPNSK